MATKDPVKYENQQHLPFEPGDTLPLPTLGLNLAIVAGTGIDVTTNPNGSVTISNTCCDEGCVPNWAVSGNTRCTGPNIEAEEADGCGNYRWIDSGVAVVWTATGATRCVNDLLQRREQNQCGTLRWTETSEACGACVPNWVATGVTRCTATNIENREDDGCGNSRWTDTGVPVTWATTGNTRCSPTFFVENEETNQCGTLRWVATTTSCAVVDPPSVHTVVSAVASPSTGVEGTTFCWTVTLNAPVAVEALTITGVLSGAEQTARSYPAPTVVIPIGATSGQLCVTTFDDTDIEATLQLCLKVATSARLTSTPGATCVSVTDNDVAPPSTHAVTLAAVATPIVEGQQACFKATVSSPVTVSPLAIAVALSGTEQAAHSYPTPRTITIPVGATTAQVCVTTIDDTAVDGTTVLTGTVVPGGRVTGTSSASISVTDNDFAAPNLSPIGDTFYGGCCATTAAPAQANISFSSAGTASAGSSCTPAPSWTWLPAGANAADYEIHIQNTGGSFDMTMTSDPEGQWLNLGTSRHWLWEFFGPTGGRVLWGTLKIRRIGGAEVSIDYQQEVRLNSECL